MYKINSPKFYTITRNRTVERNFLINTLPIVDPDENFLKSNGNNVLLPSNFYFMNINNLFVWFANTTGCDNFRLRMNRMYCPHLDPHNTYIINLCLTLFFPP